MARTRAAGLYLVNKEDRILVGHPTKHDPNFWSIPKGKIDGGETPLQAAIRETYEESNVTLSIESHNFIELGKEVYRHKKKEITLFVHFESEQDNWEDLVIKCNSNVPEDRGGFPEFDDFKWVSLDEAKEILHETQVRKLELLKENLDSYREELSFSNK